MTILATAYGTLTVANTTTPVAMLDVEITDADGFEIDLTVTGAASVAAAQRFQRLGSRVDYDRGDRVMVTFPDRELGREMVIEESADSYGDMLTVQLVGDRFSPFDGRAVLRMKRQIDAYLWYGSPINEYLAKVFTGWVIEGPYDVQPASARVTCLDAAALYREKRAKDWSLPPNSQRTRLDIALELLGIGGIPVRSVDLPNGDGGIVRKPRTLGDATILDFLRDWLGAVGVEIGFEQGAFVARRYDASQPPVIELHAGNLCLPITLTAPPTLAANVTGVVSVSFNRVEPTGDTTTVTSVVTTGPYAVMTKDGPLPEKTVVISEIITKTTRRGSIDVLVEQDERGWYAVRTAPDHVEERFIAPWFEVVANTNHGYTYPDGSNRLETQERFQTVRKLRRTKTPDADGNITRTREERSFWHHIRQAVWKVTAGEDRIASPANIPLSVEGDGLLLQSEVFAYQGRPSEVDEMVITLNADGTIAKQELTQTAYGIGAATRRRELAYGYGLDSPQWHNNQTGTYDGHKVVTTTTYRAIDEDSYEAVRVIRSGTAAPTTISERVTGALPRPERIEATSSAQEIRAEVRDEQRIGFAGEEIADPQHNEFIETAEEARALARWRAMLAGAVVLDCTIPIEGQVHKWRMVKVTLPGSSVDGLSFYVRSVTRDVATFRERIVGHYYPPQLA